MNIGTTEKGNEIKNEGRKTGAGNACPSSSGVVKSVLQKSIRYI
jgi:hypothetical protein